MAASRITLFGDNRFPEIEDMILNYLVTDTAHPQASTRFGTHFLAFPLLHVNVHLRQRVAKLLFQIVYMRERDPLLYSRVQPLAGETILLHECDPRTQLWERDDPRAVFRVYEDVSLDQELQYAEYKATSLEHAAPSLFVSFKLHKSNLHKEASDKVLLPVWMSKRRRGQSSTHLKVISTAWFEQARGGLAVSDGEGVATAPRSTRQASRQASRVAFEQRVSVRYGLRSTVPVPLNQSNVPYDIACPPLLHPVWRAWNSPAPRGEEDAVLDHGFPSWRFTYKGRYRPKRRTIQTAPSRNSPVTSEIVLDLHLIRVPLLDLLRPPIARESPYVQDTL